MKKVIKLLASAFALLLFPATIAFAKTVKSLNFTAVTRTQKVVIVIDSEQQFMEYLTPGKDYSYTILEYDYSFEQDGEKTVLRATVLDNVLNTESKVIIYSNGKYADMRIGKKQVIFTYVEQFDVEK